ncbi:NAD(P)-dependent dehydrogenase (short-subunit alcohol dehydrogenase family) [Bradyrhizobium sp. CIR48]|uniref:SDR family NAD(P)-dependent oxidoreductase n=1 Tax=Bradyrhizobium sp. CIR48 TaxID=2663840 RepID=UPI0016058F9E|nr:SDR family oxidoreductase [Bradyrhizobium sp. CIR48]MBB4423865.1 NAD(P)-dependent dehydrogenase (short-subunit alcohol dehydrogenase family) [Bradyrhizobium sp. CIR48]
MTDDPERLELEVAAKSGERVSQKSTICRRILLSGSEGGIGSAIANRLSLEGVCLAPIGHREVATNGVLVDFRNDRELANGVRRVGGPLDGIVLAHGLFRGGKLREINHPDWREVLDANLNSVFTILYAADEFLRDGASIVIISSTAGLDHSFTGGAQYTASKWGVNGLVRHLCHELAHREIRINSVCPGTINTPMAQVFGQEEAERIRAVPLRRMGEPTEVAAVVSFRLSPGSSYITGANIPVSGGLI